MKIENQLELIAKSYDSHFIENGNEDAPSYDKLPEYITSDPNYPDWLAAHGGEPTSGRRDVKDYLSPKKGMNFVDLGCCLNLMFHEYDKWPSLYHGVDISPKTIECLNDYVINNNLTVGSLYCGSIHKTPYDNNCFDIGTCIGSLEYFEKDFVEKVLIEVHRILKPNGKFVLDVPNIGAHACRVMMMVEDYMGRPDKFNISLSEFDDMLKNYFEIDNKFNTEAESMALYFLRCKK